MVAISEETIKQEEMRGWTETTNDTSLFYEDIAIALRRHGIKEKEIHELMESGTLMVSKNNTAVGLFIMGQCVCWVSSDKYPIKTLSGKFRYKCLL